MRDEGRFAPLAPLYSAAGEGQGVRAVLLVFWPASLMRTFLIADHTFAPCPATFPLDTAGR
jgi:hypothetical protein